MISSGADCFIKRRLLLSSQRGTELLNVPLPNIHQTLLLLPELTNRFAVLCFPRFLNGGFIHWIFRAPFRRIFFECRVEAS